VYEYEPHGLGSCASATGCISLVSSGKSTHESAFVDASTTGGDAFFLSSSPLTSLPPTDSAIHLYDAHVCSEALPCLHSSDVVPGKCATEAAEATCKGPATTAPAEPPVGPTTVRGPGNTAQHEVLNLKDEEKPPPPKHKKPTTHELLVKALKACHKNHNKHVRQQCERRARARYGKAASHRRKRPVHGVRR
jgi:hypothetical protein